MQNKTKKIRMSENRKEKNIITTERINKNTLTRNHTGVCH